MGLGLVDCTKWTKVVQNTSLVGKYRPEARDGDKLGQQTPRRHSDRLRSSVLRFTIGGNGDFVFFGQKIRTVQRSGLPLGSIIGGTLAHRHNFFLTGEIPVTREIDDIRQNFGIFYGEMGQGTVTKFSSHTTLGGPRITQLKFRP